MTNYKSRYSGSVIDEAITKAIGMSLTSNGWLKLKSTEAEPVDLNTLTSTGNYTISYFLNGDNAFTDYSPINISIVNINGVITQYIMVINLIFTRKYMGGTNWSTWESVKSSSYIYIQPDDPNTNENNSLWINTTDPNQCKFMIYQNGWHEIAPSDMMLKSVYDTEGKNIDFYEYTDTQIQNNSMTPAILPSKINAVTAPSTETWKSIAYGNGKFVAIAKDSTSIMTSSDGGSTWTASTTTVNAPWQKICFGNGMFVVISSSISMMTSTDGVNWTQLNATSSVNWVSIIYGNGKFVAIASDNTCTMTSTDGVNWTQNTNIPLNTSWKDITYGNGKFVAIANNTNVMTSEDGLSWTLQSPILDADWQSIAYGNGKFVAIAFNSNIAIVSTDGITWSQVTLPFSAQWTSITYGGGVFAAIASNSSRMIISVDGITWIHSNLPVVSIWTSIAYGDGKFVAISYTDNDIVCGQLTNSPISLQLYEHINDSSVHVTTLEKDIWNAKVSQSTAEADINIIKNEANTYTDNTRDALILQVDTVSADIVASTQNIENHKNNTTVHVTPEQISFWASKASPDHTHINDGHVKIDASDVVSGVLSLARIPAAAQENMKEVFSDAERFALTTDPETGVQNGDSVYVNTAESKKFYIVVDDTKLNTEEGYIQYNAGIASFIQWANVKNKPTTLAGYGITDVYAKSEIGGIVDGIVQTANQYTDTEFQNKFSKVIIETQVIQSMQSISGTWQSICYDSIANKFVVISTNDIKFTTTSDGITWTLGDMASTQQWKNIKYLNEVDPKLIAIAYGSVMSVSNPQLSGWSDINIPLGNWIDVAYGNGKYVIIENGTDNILVSSDLTTWTPMKLPVSGPWISMCYGSSGFIAIAYRSNLVIQSVDGTTWTVHNMPEEIGYQSIVYGNGKYIAIAIDDGVNTGSDKVMYSDNGIDWHTTILPIKAPWRTITYGNGEFFITSVNSANDYLMSEDGINWIAGKLTKTNPLWSSIAYGNGKYIAVGGGEIDALIFTGDIKSLSEALSNQQSVINEVTVLIQQGNAIKDNIVLNNIIMNSNGSSITALNVAITNINNALPNIETLSADILALVQ